MARRNTKPQVSEQDREQARQIAARLAGEATSVVHIPAQKLSYRVPGLRHDGSPRGSGRLKQTKQVIVTVLVIIVCSPVWLVLGLLSEIGIEPRVGSGRECGPVTVRGNESCSALNFVKQMEADQDYWLTWSSSQVALLSANDPQGPRVLWRGTGHQRPELDISKTALHWPDESRADFFVTPSERERIAERNGAP